MAEARAAGVDPFYLPGHEGFVDRLQELRAQPAAEALPSGKVGKLAISDSARLRWAPAGRLADPPVLPSHSA